MNKFNSVSDFHELTPMFTWIVIFSYIPISKNLGARIDWNFKQSLYGNKLLNLCFFIKKKFNIWHALKKGTSGPNWEIYDGVDRSQSVKQIVRVGLSDPIPCLYDKIFASTICVFRLFRSFTSSCVSAFSLPSFNNYFSYNSRFPKFTFYIKILRWLIWLFWFIFYVWYISWNLFVKIEWFNKLTKWISIIIVQISHRVQSGDLKKTKCSVAPVHPLAVKYIILKLTAVMAHFGFFFQMQLGNAG